VETRTHFKKRGDTEKPMSKKVNKLKVMLKKMIFGMAICFGLIFSMQQNCFAQGKTKDELKLERDTLKVQMKAQERIDRLKKLDNETQPNASGVSSIDCLADKSTKMLTATKDINKQVPEMYKRTIGETVDGVTDVTVKKPTIEELTSLATNIATQIKAVSDASKDVSNAANDVSKASPLQAPKAKKNLAYTKDVLAVLGPELNLNAKVVNNLIATLKSANNN